MLRGKLAEAVMRITQTSKRTALMLSVAWAKESATRWANIANALKREGYPKRETEAALIHEASLLMQQAFEVELSKVERALRVARANLDTSPARARGRRKAQKERALE